MSLMSDEHPKPEAPKPEAPKPTASDSPETPAEPEATDGKAPEESVGSSLWEMLGRGVGKGLRAAKKVGGKTSGYLERQGTEDDLESRYNILGRIVAQQIIEWKRSSIEVSDPAIQKVIDEIREFEKLAPEPPPPDSG